MEFQQIVEIHQKEKELKLELQKIIEKKKNEYNSIDEYYKEKIEKMKTRLEKFKDKTEEEIKDKVNIEIEKIESETKNILKKLEILDKNLINKSIEYIKEEFFKD